MDRKWFDEKKYLYIEKVLTDSSRNSKLTVHPPSSPMDDSTT